MNLPFHELLRCVQCQATGEICRGRLTRTDSGLRCNLCGYAYPVIQEIPVVKPTRWEQREAWYAQANENYHQFYSDRSRTVDVQTDYLKGERETMARLAQEHRLVGPCLEVGCGTGMFAETVPNFVGLDYNLDVLLAEGFSGWNRLSADARWLPFEDASMNSVHSFNTLEHVPQIDLALAEIDRVLVPGGLLVLKPAWHSARYVTELVEVRSYRQLDLRRKLTKLLLPVIKSKPYKFVTRIPWRIWRRATSGRPSRFRWTTLHPDPAELWRGGDVDAVASLDSHETILYYQSRGYQCLSHPRARQQLLAGHDVVVLRKLMPSAAPSLP